MSIITGLRKSVRSRIGASKPAVAEEQQTAQGKVAADMDSDAVGSAVPASMVAIVASDRRLANPGMQATQEPALSIDASDELGAPATVEHINPSIKEAPSEPTKAAQVLLLLHRVDGATLSELMNATGWQAHSVRGFLSATVRKKLGLDLVSAADKAGLRRYRIATVGDDAGEGSEPASIASDDVAVDASVN